MARLGMCAIAIFILSCLLPLPSFAVHQGVTLPAYEVEFLDTFNVELTHDPHQIAAETTWTGITNDLQRSVITVSVIPSEVQEQVIDKITVVIKKVTSGGGYGPGQGTLTRYTTDKAKWLYAPFSELKTAKHPAAVRTVYIAAKYNGLERAENNFFVFSVFTYFGSPVSPFRDLEQAWKYAKWKYNIDTSALSSISYDATITGKAAWTDAITKECRLGSSAFGSENQCASILGHENVHGVQSAAYIYASWANWAIGGSDFCEVDAYNWEINHATQTGLSPGELSTVIGYRNYYDRQGPKPE